MGGSDGERKIYFNDGREPPVHFLIKRGLRFAFQTKGGLSNDDGSPILLMRKFGLSRKVFISTEDYFQW